MRASSPECVLLGGEAYRTTVPSPRLTDALKFILMRAVAFEQHQLAVFLEADADDLLLSVRIADRGRGNADRQDRTRNQH